jgi:uncharacterized protein YciI
MKYTLLLFLLFAFALPCVAQKENPNYDSTLAKRLGAPENGMKKYYLVILKTGTAQVDDKAVRDSLFAGHFANMLAMAKAKKLIVAGPIAKNDQQFRGIFIIDAATREEVAALLKGDTAIASKVLEPEIFEWYGSAALPEYLPADDKVWKKRN